jgi:hypothetical protein
VLGLCIGIQETFNAYSSFESRYDNEGYVSRLKSANLIVTETKRDTDRRELKEILLRESGFSVDSFLSYIEFEKTKLGNQIGFVRCLYERAITCHPIVLDLWVRYIEYTVWRRD